MMPPDSPRGYLYALRQLSVPILSSASILYIQVDPAESRRKNYERAVPPDGEEDNTGVFHCAPLSVMLGDYGCCDMQWLIEMSSGHNQVDVETGGQTFHLSTAVFDNYDDRTTMLRGDPETWDPDQVQEIRDRLQPVMDLLIS